MRPADSHADAVYLQHTQQAARSIASHLSDVDEARFFATPLIQHAAIYQLQIIGEAQPSIVQGASSRFGPPGSRFAPVPPARPYW